MRTYLSEVVIHAATRHELEDNAEIGLPCAGAYELDHILMSDFSHYSNLLQHSQASVKTP